MSRSRTALSQRVGMADTVSFRQASATALPFADASFDGATMLHVGMNIADKRAVFAEVRRVLKPGGVFAIYDAMRQSDGAFAYPVPWSSEPATNHIARRTPTRQRWARAGFTVIRNATGATSRCSRCSGASSRRRSRSACRW